MHETCEVKTDLGEIVCELRCISGYISVVFVATLCSSDLITHALVLYRPANHIRSVLRDTFDARISCNKKASLKIQFLRHSQYLVSSTESNRLLICGKYWLFAVSSVLPKKHHLAGSMHTLPVLKQTL